MSWEILSFASLAAIVAIAGVVGLRVFRDESSLRRKRLLTEKY
jgi:hypothetical protein